MSRLSIRHQGISTPTNTTMFNPQTPGRSHQRTFFDIRSRHSVYGGDDSDDEDNGPDPLSELIKLTWNIWAVSPLFGLDFKDEVKLKQYAKRLRENVASYLSEENVSYEAKFTPLENLVNHPADPPALEVKVNSKKDEQDEVTCIYRGIFLSWGERYEEETVNVKLPLLLTRGNQSVTRSVHTVLAQTFDCLITAMPVSQEDLMWLTAITLNSSDKTERELILEYHIPGLPASDIIVVKFTVASMVTLWSKICSQQSSGHSDEQIASIIELEQVKKLFECIRLQMFDNAHLELGYCLLDKISLPTLTIKLNKLKSMNVDTMHRVLWFFQEKALHYSPNLNFTVNNEEE